MDYSYGQAIEAIADRITEEQLAEVLTTTRDLATVLTTLPSVYTDKPYSREAIDWIVFTADRVAEAYAPVRAAHLPQSRAIFAALYTHMAEEVR